MRYTETGHKLGETAKAVIFPAVTYLSGKTKKATTGARMYRMEKKSKSYGRAGCGSRF